MEFDKALGLSSFSLTILLFGFRTFQEVVEMVHCCSMPTTVYGRVVPLPLRFEIALVSLCCQNLAFNITCTAKQLIRVCPNSQY